MAHGKRIVRGHVPRTETRSAKSRFDDGSVFEQAGNIAVIHKPFVDRLAGRIDVQRKLSVRKRSPVQYFRCGGDVLVHAARASRDDALLYVNLSVFDLIRQTKRSLAAEKFIAFFFGFLQNIVGVLVELSDRIGVTGVERKGDHRLDRTEIHLDRRVVIRAVFGMKFLKRALPAVTTVILLYFFVRFPDRGKTGGFRGHHVDPVPEIHGKVFDSRPDEFHHLIFYESVFEYSRHKRECDVVRAYAFT